MEVKSDNKGPAAWIGDRHARNKTLYFISQFYPHWYWVLWLFVNTMRSQGVCTEIRYFHCHQDIRYYVCFTNGSEKSSSCNGPASALIFVQFDKFTAQCDTSGRYSSFIKKKCQKWQNWPFPIVCKGQSGRFGLVWQTEWCKSDQNLTLAVVPIALCFSGCTELSKLYRNSRKALFKRER